MITRPTWPRARLRPRRGALAVVAAAVVLLAGCTTDARLAVSAVSSSSRPAPAPTFPALASNPSDGGYQSIADMARVGSSIVAVGANEGASLIRPAFLRSQDDGRTWQVGSISASGAADQSVGETARTVVAFGSGFVAIGGASHGQSLWTSADGLTWTRRATSTAVFGQYDDVADLAVSRSGLVAVGDTHIPGHTTQSTAWRSRDGITWARVASGRITQTADPISEMSAVTGTDSGTLVAVGSSEKVDSSVTSVRVWVSIDDGVSWLDAGVDRNLAGSGTRNYLSDVTWDRTRSRFVAVGAGGSGVDSLYAGIVLSSPDGLEWSTASTELDDSSRNVYFDSITPTGTGVIVGGSYSSAGRDQALAVSVSGGRATPLAVPSAGNGSSAGINSVLTTASGTVLFAGQAHPRYDDDVRIWRRDASGVITQVPLDGWQKQLTVVVRVEGIAYGRGTYLVVGASGGVPVVWSSSNGTDFGPARAITRTPGASASNIAFGPAGWIITGSLIVGGNPQAIVWTSSDATSWQETQPAGPATTAFDYSGINGVHPYGRGWLTVGYRSVNGYYQQSASTFLSTSSGWESGVSSPSGGQQFDLEGTLGQRTMNDAVIRGSTVFAVGSAKVSLSATDDRPALWRSDDGLHWQLTVLPVPTGASGSGMDAVADSPSRRLSVAVGSRTRPGGDEPQAWRTTDFGQHVAVVPLAVAAPHTSASADQVYATAAGFVALGYATHGNRTWPVMWRTADGSAWTEVAIDDRRLQGVGSNYIDGAVIVGGTLVGVGEVVTSSGRTLVLVRQPV